MALALGRRRLKAALGARRPGAWSPSVAVVGAGLSGLGLAIELRRAGVTDLTIFEKADEVGGTWRDNTYPGSGCDVPSHLYSFSFAPKRDWTRKFAEQPEILDYARGLVEGHGLRPHLRLGTEIAACRFDEAAGRWVLTTADGSEHGADVVVCAVGQLNRPYVPEVPGASEFGGPSFHSARWDHEVVLDQQHVAVVGNGASAIQFVPAIADRVAALTVFQRSANYVAPKADRRYRAVERRLLEALAPLAWLYRWRIYWALELRWLIFRRGGRVGRVVEQRFDREVRRALVSPALPERALIPDYPPGCKRILLSNDWFPTLLRPNTTVVSEPITGLAHHAVVTADGVAHRADALIWATGFETTHFLAPMAVTGPNGRRLDDAWRDGAEAYLGVAVAGFPNLFLLYGPNTNLGHNSILFMVERQIDYVLQCLALMVRRQQPVVEVRPAVMERFNRQLGRRMRRTVWAEGCRSWYKTATGRITNNWAGPTLRYWVDTLVPRRGAFAWSDRGHRSPPAGSGPPR